MKEKPGRIVSEFNKELKLKGFKAFQLEDDSNATRVYSRKDFYKICLTTGRSRIHYADRSFDAEGTILFFGNPHIPYSWETLSTTYVGYTCLFSEEFLKPTVRSESLQQSPFFKLGGTPILKITEEQRLFLNTLFQKMIDEQKSEYAYKDELIRNYINLIIHESLKLQPSENYNQNKNAAARITSVFLELLERQFPVETPDQPLQLKNSTGLCPAVKCACQLPEPGRKGGNRQIHNHTYYGADRSGGQSLIATYRLEYSRSRICPGLRISYLFQ
ncbi:MAG: hypothetical protein LUG51_10535 [Tannerellaceae bacterium]|nr:hypothetical protein [Tannerellaceae bacterium]